MKGGVYYIRMKGASFHTLYWKSGVTKDKVQRVILKNRKGGIFT